MSQSLHDFLVSLFEQNAFRVVIVSHQVVMTGCIAYIMLFDCLLAARIFVQNFRMMKYFDGMVKELYMNLY